MSDIPRLKHIVHAQRESIASLNQALDRERAYKRELHDQLARMEKEIRDLRLELDRRNREIGQLLSMRARFASVVLTMSTLAASAL